MKWLITGGAGFIGSNFIYYILDKYLQHEVVCIDKLTYAGNLYTLKSAIDRTNFKFIKADITDEQIIYEIFKNEKPDIVVNFAAESHVDKSIKNPRLFTITNVLGTQILMDACLQYGIKRFHQVSTDEVYGDLPLNKDDAFFTEDMPVKASSPYAASKASADLIALSYHRTYKLPVSISRCSNNYGPYHFPEKLIPLVITRALADKDLPIYGSGKNIRDWLYVKEHCEAIDLIITKGKEGDIYNIGSRNERTNIYVVKSILRELGKPESLITYVNDRPGHDLRYAIDASKIEKELGWKATYTFEEGIRITVKWFLENKDWWEKIIAC